MTPSWANDPSTRARRPPRRGRSSSRPVRPAAARRRRSRAASRRSGARPSRARRRCAARARSPAPSARDERASPSRSPTCTWRPGGAGCGRVRARHRRPSASIETCAPPPVSSRIASTAPRRRRLGAELARPLELALVDVDGDRPARRRRWRSSPRRARRRRSRARRPTRPPAPACTCRAAQAVMKRQPSDAASTTPTPPAPHQIQVRPRQRDVLRERAPGREARLEVALAELRLAEPARLADPAAAAERDRHAVADRQAAHRGRRPPRPRRRARGRGTCGSAIDGSWPIHPCQSLRQTPVARTSTTTPSARADRVVARSRSTGAAAKECITAARIALLSRVRGPLSLPPDELRRLGHHVWDRLVDRWEALDGQPPIAPIDPELVARRDRAVPRRADRPAAGDRRAVRRDPAARPARRPPALLRPHRQPEQPDQRPRRPDRHGPQRVRRQLDGRRGRLGASSSPCSTGCASGWGCRARPRACSSAAAASARSPRSPRPRTQRVDDRDQATGYVQEHTHAAVAKAWRMLGFNPANLRVLRADPAHRLQPAAVDAARAPRPRGRAAAVRASSAPRARPHRQRRPAQRPRRPRAARGPVVPRRRRLRRARPADAARAATC